MQPFKTLFASAIAILATTLSFSYISHAGEIVKQSSSGICHDSSSSYYHRTKSFTPFPSLSACLDAGGRLPKGATRQMKKAIKEADDEGRQYSQVYDRHDWPHWIDADRDCQDTRHETLIAHSQVSVSFKSSKSCKVTVGSWYDPYSGDTFTLSKQLDLDHIVPLKYAHTRGGHAWSRKKRQQFANDPENLILVSLSLNRQKGAKGLTEWLPPNQPYRCEYIQRFDGMMVKYGLIYTPSETRTVNRMKTACGN